MASNTAAPPAPPGDHKNHFAALVQGRISQRAKLAIQADRAARAETEAQWIRRVIYTYLGLLPDTE